jgi:hypothetical protein
MLLPFSSNPASAVRHYRLHGFALAANFDEP